MSRPLRPAWCHTGQHRWMSPNGASACPHCRPTPAKAKRVREDIDTQVTRDERRHLRTSDQLAHRVVEVSKAQKAGDVHALRQALVEVSSAAETWAALLPTPRDVRMHGPHFQIPEQEAA